ncbi:MAG: riboflavin kinase/FMN adenylyltransferase [Arenicella sp.]|jgi:riboflavin kinase/FMN adenylyltransferase
MTLISGLKHLNPDHKPCVASIGNYDGVHRGHQYVVATLLEHSQRLALPSTVITFEPLAKEYFQPNSVQRLTTIEERAELLMALGVDQVLCVDFNQAFASYSPTEFIQDVLIQGLGIRHLCVGDDFRFGKDREGDFALLSEVGRSDGFKVTAHDTFEVDGQRVSSGRIRQALGEGNFELAESLLGRPYSISGVISKGQQLGRTINYPTANIVLPKILMPINGVFAVTAKLQNGDVVVGVANLGNRPTVDGKENRLEVHLFDFEQDIYDQTMNVSFVEKIRDELKFASFDDLKVQIQKDAARARVILSDI